MCSLPCAWMGRCCTQALGLAADTAALAMFSLVHAVHHAFMMLVQHPTLHVWCQALEVLSSPTKIERRLCRPSTQQIDNDLLVGSYNHVCMHAVDSGHVVLHACCMLAHAGAGGAAAHQEGHGCKGLQEWRPEEEAAAAFRYSGSQGIAT